MRILIAVHHFPPAYQSGSEQHAYRVALDLQQRGHDVRVVCIDRIDVGAQGAVTWRDEEVDGLPVRRLSFNLRTAPDPQRWEYDNPWVADHVRELLRQDPIDVLHLFSGYLMTGRTLRAAYDLGVPTVVTLTDFWFFCPRITLLQSNGDLSAPPFDPARCARCLGEQQRRYRWPGRLLPGLMQRFWRLRRRRVHAIAERQRFLRETLLQVDHLFSPSEFLRSMFIDQGVPSTRIDIRRQGIDLTSAGGRRARSAWAPPLRIGYVGQLAEHKGAHVLIAAVRRLSDAPVTLHVYGSEKPFPAYAANLHRLANGDQRIVFAGTFSGAAERQAVFDQLDVLVVPSVWYDNNPMSINEALSAGVPVVTTDLGSMPEAVHHGGNGLLFQRGDDADLARQLRRLIDEPDLLTRLQAGIIPPPSVADEVDQTEAVYQQLVAARRREDLG